MYRSNFMKKYLPIVAIVVILGGITYAFLRSGSDRAFFSDTNPDQGRVVLSIKDYAPGSLLGATAINVNVDAVEVHSATEGWVTISTSSKIYDLLQLKQSGVATLIADANLNAGTYDQIRLTIKKVEVTTANGTQEAKLPSNSLKIIGNLTVLAGQTSSALLDFLADKSLHITGNGKFIFAPVVRLETRNDVVVAIDDSDEKVDIRGGKIETEKTIGMDEKGEIDDDFELKGNLSIDENDMIHIEENDSHSEDTDGDDTEIHNSLSLNFAAQNNSGLSGTATLEERDGKVKVELEVKATAGILGAVLAAEPAHIHLGACPNVGAVKYPLSPVVNGKSETTLNISLADLRANLPLAINVHKSVAEIGVYIACTDIKF